MTLENQERILKIKKLRLKLAEKCRNLIDGKRGQGTSIYCGDEDRAEFLIQSLVELGIDADCEIYTVDGEYHVEVKL